MSPRFCIKEKRGAQSPKFMSMGDLAKSWANLVTELSDNFRPKCIGRLLALCRLLVKQGAVGLELRSSDFPNAYKTIPAHPRSYDVANVTFASPGDGKGYLARLSNISASVQRRIIGGRLITRIQKLAVRLFRLRAGGVCR